MKSMLLICAAIVSASAVVAAPDAPEVADSKLANSTVSVAVEPQLNDGRLVIKVAAKNGSSAPVAFGPGSIAISTVAGQPIALSSLQKLIKDVRMAAGMAGGAPPGDAPTQGAYAMRQQPGAQDGSGRMDVTGYTGGSAIAPSETVRWSKHSLDRKTADAQIAGLKHAILQDQTIAPGQIAVGQIVSQKLKFAKDEDRTLHLVVQIAGDTHPFTIGAPSD
jgi:hypothetical protein